MSIQSLGRVLWRLRQRYGSKSTYRYVDLRTCIMYECGTSPITYLRNRKAMLHLGWIASHSKTKFRLTNKDLEE